MKSALYWLATVAVVATPVMARPRPVSAPPAADPVVAYNPSPYDRAPWWMNQGVITQTGYVFAEVPANRATFSATFETNAETVDKAQAKAIDKTRALNQALDKLGKDAVRVTTSFSMRALYEEYRDKNGNRIEDQRADKINGYQVSLNLSLEVRDMAALEKAYALVLASSPSSASDIYFNLQPSNEQKTWLYTEAVKDAHARALAATEAAGGHVGAIKLIDPSGRACETDVLVPGAQNGSDGIMANEVMVTGMRKSMAPPPPPPPPPPPAPVMAMDAAGALEAQAMKNPFIQTPPLERLEAKACVIYGLN